MKLFLRAVVILAALFVVLYVGMYNTHSVDFFFPLVLEKKVSQPAALLFFVMFAIGVVAGLMFRPEPQKAQGSSEPRKKK
jgi:uncharacterized membrane protein YciS (DUF1049 family)